MAKVVFHAMQMDFAELKRIASDYSETEFGSLVFQAEIEDPKKWNDRYILIGYIVASNGTTTANLDSKFLKQNNSKEHDFHGKLNLGNYPLSRKKVIAIIKNSPATTDYLLFIPEQFDMDPRYVCYKIIPRLKDGSAITAFDDDGNLNPSPPADPGV